MTWTIRLDSIDNFNPLSTTNCVLVKNLYENKGARTQSGIILPIDDQFDRASHANRIGEVVKVPKEILFNKGNPKTRVEWKTSLEVLPGDTVWYSFMAWVTGDKVISGGETYIMVPYGEIKVVKRPYNSDIIKMNGVGHSVANNRVVDGYEIIPVNGYVLLEEVKEEVGFLAYKKIKTNFSRGVVSFVGRPNDKYTTDERDVTFGVLKPGDKVIFNNARKHVMLEDGLHKKFDGNKEYLVMQSRYIVARDES